MVVVSGMVGLKLSKTDEFYFEHKKEIKFGKKVLSALKTFYNIDIQPEDTVYINGIPIHKEG